MERIGGFAWRVVTLQPSELAKPVLVLFLAYFLQTRIHQMDDGRARFCGRLRCRWCLWL